MIVYLRLTFVALTVRKSVMRALVTSFIQILLSFSSHFELALSLCVSMLIITMSMLTITILSNDDCYVFLLWLTSQTKNHSAKTPSYKWSEASIDEGNILLIW
jgi:hypothetical protein